MKKTVFFVAILALLFGGVSCEKQTEIETEDVIVEEDAGEDSGEKPYVLSPFKAAELIRKSNKFAFDFLIQMDASEKGDFLFSPLCMQFLLGMILNGAEGRTAEGVCQALDCSIDDVEAVNAFSRSMLEPLSALDQNAEVSIGNAIFVDNRYPLLDSFKGMVEKYYRAETYNLDFSFEARSLKVINDWCFKQTNKRIPIILDEVSKDAKSYFFNAIYFKGAWLTKFSKENTTDEVFTRGEGATKTVPMMKKKEALYYHENCFFQAIRLPYGNGAFNMMVLLPRQGRTLNDVMTSHGIVENMIYQEMSRREVDLWLPKFEVKYATSLDRFLPYMGMPGAFESDRADFSSMSDVPLCLSFVKQEARIKIDEEGTDSITLNVCSFDPYENEPVVFHADRPFLYLITESSTGVVLFAGKYSGE